MPDLHTLWLFSLAALALLLVPGPAVIYIVTRSVDQGRLAGLVSMLGIHVGSLVHVTAAALGLSAILVTSSAAYSVVKYVGAAYLVFLGLRTLLARVEPAPDVVTERRSLRRIFFQGVAVNVLNPKTALFFFAFLPQFVDVSRGSVPVQMVVLGAVFIAGMLSDSAYAVAASSAGSWLRRSAWFPRVRRYISGSVYLGLGAAAALSGSRSKV
jgi:threonine/homoserine/homoserine lactone efflux protein